MSRLAVKRRTSWKCTSAGRPTAASAGCQTFRRKFERRRYPPLATVNTRPSRSSAPRPAREPYSSRCAASTANSPAGKLTRPRDFAVLGSPKLNLPLDSKSVSATSISRRSMSMRQTRKPTSSPHRRPVAAALRISARYRPGTASAMAPTCSGSRANRSLRTIDGSLILRHGDAVMRPSSIASSNTRAHGRKILCTVAAASPSVISASTHAFTSSRST